MRAGLRPLSSRKGAFDRELRPLGHILSLEKLSTPPVGEKSDLQQLMQHSKNTCSALKFHLSNASWTNSSKVVSFTPKVRAVSVIFNGESYVSMNAIIPAINGDSPGTELPGGTLRTEIFRPNVDSKVAITSCQDNDCGSA